MGAGETKKRPPANFAEGRRFEKTRSNEAGSATRFNVLGSAYCMDDKSLAICRSDWLDARFLMVSAVVAISNRVICKCVNKAGSDGGVPSAVKRSQRAWYC